MTGGQHSLRVIYGEPLPYSGAIAGQTFRQETSDKFGLLGCFSAPALTAAITMFGR
jgi:hypothetical protein